MIEKEREQSKMDISDAAGDANRFVAEQTIQQPIVAAMVAAAAEADGGDGLNQREQFLHQFMI